MKPSLRPHGPAARAPGRLVPRISLAALVAGAAWGSLPERARSAEAAAYALNEGAGSFAADATGHGNQATLAGAAWTAGGRYGAALSFDGAGSRATVPDAAGLDLRSGITIEAWVYPLGHGGWETVVMKEASGEIAYALYANEEEPRPGVWVRVGGVSFNASGDSPVPVNSWTHLAGTYDGTTLRLYVNGVEEAVEAAGGDIEVSDQPLTFGGNAIWGEYFRGFIDEIRIHDRALSPAEIEADMAAPISGGGSAVPIITAPVEGSVVAGAVLVSALPSTGAAVAGIQFLLDGAALGAEDVTAPYSIPWDTRTAAEGPHSLAARERQASGALRTSTAVSVTVLNTVGGTIRADGGLRHQEIDGFGVNANSAGWNGGELAPAIDLLAEVQGAYLWRVIVESHEGWEATNDNGDPFAMNASYYANLYETPKFRAAWDLCEYLEGRGLSVLLGVLGGVPDWMGRTRIDEDQEEEWVEMIASFLHHGRQVRGLRIPLISPLHEPDLGFPEGPAVAPPQYARLLGKLIARLEALGLGDVRLTGPDTASVDAAADSYLPALLGNARIMGRLDRFAVHSFTGFLGSVPQTIANSDHPDIPLWMTEAGYPCHICDSGDAGGFEWEFSRGTVLNLFGNLRDGASGALAYDGYDSLYEHQGTRGYWGQLALTESGDYLPRKRFYANAQVFRFVAPGAVRIGFSTGSPAVTGHAFLHPGTGRVTIVGHHAGTQNLTVSGQLAGVPLPPWLEHYQTSESANLLRRPDVLTASGGFTVVLPPDTIFTLTSPLPPGEHFTRGDGNQDRALDISDPIHALVHLFLGTPGHCLDAMDADDNGRVEITDAIFLLQYLFQAGASPRPPFPVEGEDPTPDALDCAS